MPAPSLITAGASGTGLATVADGTVLDVWFPNPHLAADPGSDSPAASPATLDGELSAAVGADEVRGVETVIVTTSISSLAEPPADTGDAYLRLHLLSTRLVVPRTINLEGIFSLLPNNCWTNLGPVRPVDLPAVRLRARSRGIALAVHGVDKFPRMTDYVVPEGVRIADADRVRLGAYLSPGTTVMHEGFCNFNAGTLGASMVEGRISQGVLVGDGSDIGGSASIQGTLSGGGTEQLSIGERCLLGANAGIGISLGDDCVVEAGLYVTSGSKILLRDPDGERTVKARDLSGMSGLQYWRNSTSGAIEATPRVGSWGALNAALHSGQ